VESVESSSQQADRSPREQRQFLSRNLTREQLLDVAEELFGEKGFDHTTLRAIAEAAEMSIGAVYLVVPSKDELYSAVFARRMSIFNGSLTAAITADSSARARLRAFVAYLLQFHHTYPAFGRLVLRHAGATLFAGLDFVDPTLSQGFAETEGNILVGVIEHGQRTGEFRPGDARTMLHFVSAIMLAHLSSDPDVVGPASDLAPISVDELQKLVLTVVE
jgi:AcrR family transcriptional regulator